MATLQQTAGEVRFSRAAEPYWRQVWRRLRQHKLAVIGLGSLVLMTAGAILIPLLSPYRVDELDLPAKFSGPTAAHWFGTDELGRDTFVRIWEGARISLTVGFVVALSSAGIGGVVGAFVGYVGGPLDNFVMRIVDVLHTIPTIVLLLIMTAVLGPGLATVITLLIAVEWASPARLIRGVVLSLREQAYIESAVTIGASRWRIVSRHIIPNAMAPLIVSATLNAAGAIRSETTLSFLGLGVQPPTPSWGNLLSNGQVYVFTAPWQVVLPGLFIFVALMSFNFLGDALRDSLDPRLRGSR